MCDRFDETKVGNGRGPMVRVGKKVREKETDLTKIQ